MSDDVAFYQDNNFLESCCRFYNQNSDALILWFGGLGEPFLSKELSNITQMDCLVFRDINSNWYKDGVSEKYNSRIKMIKNLEIFKKKKKYKKVICCGQSSGGYAALYFLHHMDGDLSIAFAPQTGNQFSGDGHMSPPIKLNKVSNFFRKNTKNIIINISRSEKEHDKIYKWDDWWQIKDLKKFPNVTIITHPYDSHPTSLFLKKTGIFYKYMKNLIDIYC